MGENILRKSSMIICEKMEFEDTWHVQIRLNKMEHLRERIVTLQKYVEALYMSSKFQAGFGPNAWRLRRT